MARVTVRLVLRGPSGEQTVREHDFFGPVKPGSQLMFDGVAWVVKEIRENPHGRKTVLCEREGLPPVGGLYGPTRFSHCYAPGTTVNGRAPHRRAMASARQGGASVDRRSAIEETSQQGQHER